MNQRQDLQNEQESSRSNGAHLAHESTPSFQLLPPPFQFKVANADQLEEQALDDPEISQFQTANAEPPPPNNKIDSSNNNGLPTQLKHGIEALSGFSMDDVNVHYNSSKPAQLQAHAFAQGTDIHIASGQEKHLPHEAWHVVQQKQGRVKPTVQLKGAFNVNDDEGLEKEADIMGEKASKTHEKGYNLNSGSEVNKNVQPIQGNFTEIWSLLYDLGIVISVEILVLVGSWGIEKVMSFVHQCRSQGINPQIALSEAAQKEPESKTENPLLGDSSSSAKGTRSSKSTSRKEEADAALPGDCLYTAVLGDERGGEKALRQIATQWLLNQEGVHEIDNYGDREAIIGVVSEPQQWAGDAGDLSVAVLAFSQGIEINIVTATNIYVFNEGALNGSVVIYYADNHFTKEPQEVHLSDKKVKIKGAPKKADSAVPIESLTESLEGIASAKKKKKKKKKKKNSGGTLNSSFEQSDDSGGEWTSTTKTKAPKGPKKPSPHTSFNGINPTEALNAYDKDRGSSRYGTHPAAKRIVKHLNNFGKGNVSSYTQVRIDSNTNATGRLYFGDDGSLFWSSNISHVNGEVLNKVSIYWFDPDNGWVKLQ